MVQHIPHWCQTARVQYDSQLPVPSKNILTEAGYPGLLQNTILLHKGLCTILLEQCFTINGKLVFTHKLFPQARPFHTPNLEGFCALDCLYKISFWTALLWQVHYMRKVVFDTTMNPCKQNVSPYTKQVAPWLLPIHLKTSKADPSTKGLQSSWSKPSLRSEGPDLLCLCCNTTKQQDPSS